MQERLTAVCRFCGRQYRVPRSAAGRRARCRDCGEIFHVPMPTYQIDDTIAQWLLEDQARETRKQETGVSQAMCEPGEYDQMY
ncbi:MAG: hypothetical protein JSU68_09635 [Phycisphaerales bacterium]|nr:MAG: hypothetical protein JSU68_09635 [Phycisphaerales bacterium]